MFAQLASCHRNVRSLVSPGIALALAACCAHQTSSPPPESSPAPVATSSGAVASSAGPASSASEAPVVDSAATAARDLAGAHASDCGRAVWGSNRTSVDECVVAMFRGGSQAFFAGFESRVVDDETIEYWVRDGSGGIYRLRTPPAPFGTDRSHRRVTRQRCIDPHVATFSGAARLTCRAYDGE